MSNKRSPGDLLKKAVELTARKKCLAEKILRLTKEQTKLLKPEQTDELLQLIEQRQRCIDTIAEIDPELQQMEDETCQLLGLSSLCIDGRAFHKGWQRVINMQRDIRLLLGEAQIRDELNRKVVLEEFALLKKTISDLHLRRGSILAYRGAMLQPGGYFIDHKK